MSTGKDNLSRLEWIDELRGVAILVVVISHYRVLFDTNLKLAALDFLGHGVQLFYLLSGFILYKIYLNKIDSGKKYFSFISRRYFRVAPMFYVATLISFILFFPSIYSPYLNLISHLLILPMGFNPKFINGIIGVEWSIFVEFSFYLVFPIIAGLFRKYKYVFMALSIIFIALFSVLPRLLNMPDEIGIYIYFLPSTQFGFFLAGMFLVEISTSSYLDRIKVNVKKTIFVIAVMGIILVPVVANSMPKRLYGLLIFLVLMVYVYGTIPKEKFLSNILLWLGQRSYSIYLLHIPLLIWMTPWVKEYGISMALLLCVGLLGLSSITYRYIELAGTKFGRKLENKRLPA